MSGKFEVHFEIEKNCLLNCKHCSSIEIKKINDIGYGVSDINNLLEILNKDTYIYLTGGEPLLNKEILEIINEIKLKNINTKIGIFTCGIIKSDIGFREVSIEESLKLKEKGLENTYISIYDNNESNHDSITGIKNSLKYTEKTIKNFINANIDVKVHLVINKKNKTHINDVIEYLAELGVSEIRILRIVKHGNAIKNWNEVGVNEEEQIKIIKRIFENQFKFNSKITFSGFPEMVACRPFENSKFCQGGTNLLYVTFDGIVYPCACTRGKLNHKISRISELNEINTFIKNQNEYHEKCLNKL